MTDRSVRSLTGLLAVILACGACGSCGKKPATEAPEGSAPGDAAAATAAPGASEAAEVRRQPKPLRGRGLTALIVRAMGQVRLGDEQVSAVDAALDPLRASEAHGKGDFDAFQSDLLAGIRAGKLDTAKVRTDLASVDTAVQARRDREATAINALYAALDATARKAVGSGVGGRYAARAPRPVATDGGVAERVKPKVDRLTTDLGLTADQQRQVAAILAKLDPSPAEAQVRVDEGKRQMEAFLSAFEGDRFDARKVEILAPPRQPHEILDRDVRFLSQLVPLLTPAQREKVATARQGRSWLRIAEAAEGFELADEVRPYGP